MSVQLSQRAYHEVCVVTVSGRFNKVTASEVRDYLAAKIDVGYEHLVVDVRECAAFSGAAAAVLREIRDRTEALDGWCRPVTADWEVWRLLHGAGVWGDIFESVPEAVWYEDSFA